MVPSCRSGAVIDPKFADKIVNMQFYGVLGNFQRIRNRFILLSFSDECQNL